MELHVTEHYAGVIVEIRDIGCLRIATVDRRLAGIAVVIGNEIMLPHSTDQRAAVRANRIRQNLRWQAKNRDKYLARRRAQDRRRRARQGESR